MLLETQFSWINSTPVLDNQYSLANSQHSLPLTVMWVSHFGYFWPIKPLITTSSQAPSGHQVELKNQPAEPNQLTEMWETIKDAIILSHYVWSCLLISNRSTQSFSSLLLRWSSSFKDQQWPLVSKFSGLSFIFSFFDSSKVYVTNEILYLDAFFSFHFCDIP